MEKPIKNGWFGGVTHLFSETPGDGFHFIQPLALITTSRPAPPGLSEVIGPRRNGDVFFFPKRDIYIQIRVGTFVTVCVFFSGFFKLTSSETWEVSVTFFLNLVSFTRRFCLNIIYIYGHPPQDLPISFFDGIDSTKGYFAKAKNVLFFVFILKYYTQKHSNSLCFLHFFCIHI